MTLYKLNYLVTSDLDLWLLLNCMRHYYVTLFTALLLVLLLLCIIMQHRQECLYNLKVARGAKKALTTIRTNKMQKILVGKETKVDIFVYVQ